MVSYSQQTGQWVAIKRHYYYPGFRENYRFPPEKRSIAEELPVMVDIGQEERITVALDRSRESGFHGVSQLHRLHKLYKFDVLQDLVFDAMHLIPLNLRPSNPHGLTVRLTVWDVNSRSHGFAP